MSAISVFPLLLSALLLSAVLAWLIRTGAPLSRVGMAMAAACVAMLLIELIAFRSLRTAVPLWLVFVVVPTLAVFGLSRSAMFATRPWLLLVVGPFVFLLSMVVMMIGYNLLFASHFG